MGFGHQHAPGEHDHASDSNARRRLGIAFTLVFGIVIAQGSARGSPEAWPCW